MTTPANTAYQGGQRGYIINGQWHIGVTSLIKATLADAATLFRWKQKKLINHVLDVRAELDNVIVDRDEIIARAIEADKQSGPEAQLGTDVHLAIEQHETGQGITITDAKALKHLDRWLWLKDDHDLEVVTVEQTLVNPHYGYAGTLDQIVRSNIAPYRRDRFILDVKTGKGVYDTYALQLALLSRCTHWLTPTGELREIRDDRRPNTDIGLIAKLGPRSAHLHRVDLHQAWTYAKHLLALHEFQTGAGQLLIGHSIPGKTANADRAQRNELRMTLLDRARNLDAELAATLRASWPKTSLPKLTDPTLDWTWDALAYADELVANAERGAIA